MNNIFSSSLHAISSVISVTPMHFGQTSSKSGKSVGENHFCIFEDNLAHDFIMNSAKFGTSFSQDAMHVGM